MCGEIDFLFIKKSMASGSSSFTEKLLTSEISSTKLVPSRLRASPSSDYLANGIIYGFSSSLSTLASYTEAYDAKGVTLGSSNRYFEALC